MKIKHSPWGPVQHQNTVADGIESVSTAGHGGFWLSAERWARVAELFPNQQRYAPEQWLEEDCDWALAVLAWPELFPPRSCHYAVQTFDNANDYCAPTAAWLATPAADAVRARAALWTPEERAAFEAELNTIYNREAA